MSDMTLVLFDACTMLALYAGIVKEKKRSLLWWLASVSMGLAFVTKGPVGIVLPAAAFLVYLGVTRQLKLIKPLHVVLGAITATLIAMPWFYAAYQANGTWALAYFFIRENFVRYTGSMYDTHKPVWFMVQSLALGFLPWTVLIPFALASQIPQMKAKIAERMNDPKLYMWIWTAVLLGFFSFSRGKCDYYALPVYPAVACLVALHLVEKPNSKLQKISAIVLALLFLTVGIASPIVLTAFSSQMGLASWWAMPAALIISGIVALAACSNRRLTLAFSTLFVGLCLGISGFAIQLFPTVMSSRSIDAYAQAISKTTPNTAIGIHKDLHHWVSELTFQSQREPHELQNSKAVSELFAAGPALVLIPENVYNQALLDEPALQNAQLKVVDRRRVSTHPLTPGYVLKRKGNLFDRTLLLVSN
jgi:4-amino-4-deoxy-L-arabinose transferase-like glycosyltransferase